MKVLASDPDPDANPVTYTVENTTFYRPKTKYRQVEIVNAYLNNTYIFLKQCII